MIASALIDRAGAGDLTALADLDARGLSPAPGEDAPAFAERLRGLNANFQSMEEELAKGGTYTVEGVTVRRDARIPAEVFAVPGDATEALYGFRCDWVPGFFLDPRFSGLFGGCAFYFFPDFFALFIIRHSFQTKERWLWYRRDELLAHELCHVARIALLSEEFEETFAYQTSASSFRKLIGGIFRKQTDSFLFLGVTFVLLFAQILRTQWLHTMPIWPFWSLVGLVFAWLLIRHAFHCRRLSVAQHHIAELFGKENALPVLFRCTDDELHRFASTEPQSLKTWIAEQTSLRWQVIRKRFPLK